MEKARPQDHPLHRLFRAALDKAFQEERELYAPGVASHLSDEVLADFVHVDRLYRLRDGQGQRLDDLPRMLQLALAREGPERRIEVDTYIGAFTLFMGGFFPTSLARNRWLAPNPMVSKVGGIFVSFQQPLEYYAAEGRNAYGRAAETARLFAPDSRETYSLLADRFDRYTDLLRRVKSLIADDPQLRRAESFLD